MAVKAKSTIWAARARYLVTLDQGQVMHTIDVMGEGFIRVPCVTEEWQDRAIGEKRPAKSYVAYINIAHISSVVPVI